MKYLILKIKTNSPAQFHSIHLEIFSTSCLWSGKKTSRLNKPNSLKYFHKPTRVISLRYGPESN